MGFLTDIFAASPADGAAIDPGSWRDTEHDLEVLECCGFEPTVTLGVLEQVLVGTPLDDAIRAPIRLSADGTCWISTMRSSLQDALAEGRDDWLPVAVACVATGDLGDALPADLAAFLDELSRFVRASTAQGLRVFVWGSL